MPNSSDPPCLNSDGVRSECAMPPPAVIQLTSPGRMGCTVPRLSRWRSSPSKRYVTVASPMCGCGATSSPRPAPRTSGPIWSRKMKGPTMRLLTEGSARRTLKPSTSSRARVTPTASTAPRALALKWHLVLLVVGALLPLVGFAAVIVYRLAESERAANDRHLLRSAQDLSHALDRELQSTIRALSALAESEDLDGEDLTKFHSE